MVESTSRVEEARRNVLALEVRKILQDLFRTLTSRQQLEHVDDAHSQAANARTTAALFGANRDARQQVR